MTSTNGSSLIDSHADRTPTVHAPRRRAGLAMLFLVPLLVAVAASGCVAATDESEALDQRDDAVKPCHHGQKCPPAPVCGDGTCNGSETCSTCPSDCGACPATNPCVASSITAAASFVLGQDPGPYAVYTNPTNAAAICDLTAEIIPLTCGPTECIGATNGGYTTFEPGVPFHEDFPFFLDEPWQGGTYTLRACAWLDDGVKMTPDVATDCVESQTAVQ